MPSPPLNPNGIAEAGRPPAADKAEVRSLSLSILVVDDERNIRRTLDLVLRGEGYDVVEAESAERALELLASGRRPVDLAIIDILPPGMSGLELLSRLRQDDATSELPVIVISGHATVQDAV